MRPIRIFLTGTAALIAVFLVMAKFSFALLLFAGIVFTFVIAGFCIPIRALLPVYVPALSEWEFDEVIPDVKPQPYPQLCIFRIEIRNLPILLIAPLYCLGLAGWILSRPEMDLNDFLNVDWGLAGVFFARAAGIASSLAVTVAWIWLTERILLRRSVARLGLLHSRMGDGDLSYEYFDNEGERQGGTAFPWGEARTAITPVFVNESDGTRSKPGFAFVFHRFRIADVRHAPSELDDDARVQIND